MSYWGVINRSLIVMAMFYEYFNQFTRTPTFWTESPFWYRFEKFAYEMKDFTLIYNIKTIDEGCEKDFVSCSAAKEWDIQYQMCPLDAFCVS